MPYKDKNKQNTWQREHSYHFTIRLNNNTDKELIEVLEKQTSRQGYIRELIRQDIKRKKEGEA